jgi:hypothetical protein
MPSLISWGPGINRGSRNVTGVLCIAELLYSFKGGTDVASPISSLVADAAGNLYGTTSDDGAIYEFTP